MIKSTIIYCVLFFALPIIGLAQANRYYPFPDSNAVWNEANWYNNNPPPILVTNPQIFFLNGDTSILTVSYKKVFSSGYSYAQSSTCCYYYNRYEGAIRQDTTHRKVYFCKSSTTIDTLLYDFNLHIGDTLPKSYINQDTANYISSIDSILIGTKYRKRYHVGLRGSTSPQDSSYVYLIEGIGSTFGLTYPLSGQPFESGYILNCFIQNDSTLYTNTLGSCDLTVGIKELNNKTTTIKIYPNPFSTSAILQVSEIYKDIVITIYNSLGQQVKQIKNVYLNAIPLEREELKQGLYFLKLTQNNTTCAMIKFVIID